MENPETPERLRHFQTAVKVMMFIVSVLLLSSLVWACGTLCCQPSREERYGDDLRFCVEQDASAATTRECILCAKQRYGNR